MDVKMCRQNKRERTFVVDGNFVDDISVVEENLAVIMIIFVVD